MIRKKKKRQTSSNTCHTASNTRVYKCALNRVEKAVEFFRGVGGENLVCVFLVACLTAEGGKK